VDVLAGRFAYRAVRFEKVNGSAVSGDTSAWRNGFLHHDDGIAGKIKEWVSGKKLGAMTIPKELLDSNLGADLSMMKADGK